MQIEEAIIKLLPIVDNDDYTDQFRDACKVAVDALKKRIQKKPCSYCDKLGLSPYQAYRDYVERALNSNYIGDSPCSYCFKTSCPRSHVITCSNKSN